MKIPAIVIFGLMLMIIDLPFISMFLAPRYAKLGMTAGSLFYAFLAYLCMTLAWFLIKGDVKKAALVGLVVYGTYTFTLATMLRGFTTSVGLFEAAWGPILYTLATLGTNKVMSVM